MSEFFTTVVPFVLVLLLLHFIGFAWDLHKRRTFVPFEISSSDAIHLKRVCMLEKSAHGSVVGSGGRVDMVMGLIEDGDNSVIFPKGTRAFRVASDHVEYHMPSGDIIVLYENDHGKSKMWLKKDLKKAA